MKGQRMNHTNKERKLTRKEKQDREQEKGKERGGPDDNTRTRHDGGRQLAAKGGRKENTKDENRWNEEGMRELEDKGAERGERQRMR